MPRPRSQPRAPRPKATPPPPRRQPAPARPPRSWAAFERSLATAIETLDGDFLVLDVKGSGRYVQVHVSAQEGVRAEAVSNAWLPERDRLDPERIAALAALGWSPPTQAPDGPRSPGGSPNHFRDFPVPFAAAEVARVLVATLSGPLGAGGPDALAYRAFAARGGEIQLPALGLSRRPSVTRRARGAAGAARRPPVEPAEARVRRAVLAELRRGTGNPAIAFDRDGDALLEVDGVSCCVRVLSLPLAVRVWAALDVEVPDGEEALGLLNELNAQLVLARVIVAGEHAFLSADLLAEPFRPEHLGATLELVAGLVPEVTRAFRSGDAVETQA